MMTFMKHWRSGCALALCAGLMSSLSFAGYDARATYVPQCSSATFFDYAHNQCMASCRAKYGDSWQDQEGYRHFKHCYMRCKYHMYSRCGFQQDYFPQQPSPLPSP